MNLPMILRASVLTTNDPLGAGRVKVQAPQATGGAGLWADPMLPGSAATPPAGSAVWVLFESGNPGLPVYLPPAQWTPWIPIPTGYLASGWRPNTGAYRLGPAGQVQYQGEIATPSSTGSVTLANAAAVLALPAAIAPQVPASYPAAVAVGTVSASVVDTLRITGGTGTLYGGGWTYTGQLFVSLAAVSYTTDT